MDKDKLNKLIFSDPNLSDEERETLKKIVGHQDFVNKLVSGGLGAGLALIFSKFLKMSNTAQILLTIAGYGLGRVLLENKQSSQNDFLEFDSKTKAYNVKQRTN